MTNQELDEALAYLDWESYEQESLQEEFNLDLMLMEAEQEMITNLTQIHLESANIVALNEGIKETVMGFIQKVIQGIQKAWDRFINLFTQAELKHLKNNVKPLIDKTDNIDFTINNYKKINLDKFDDLIIVHFDYERMKDKLTNTSEFYKEYYSQLDVAGSRNIKAAVEKFVGKEIVPKYECKKPQLLEIYKFATEDYFKYRDLIKKDIDFLNQSCENIKNAVNQVSDSETPVNTNQESYNFDYFSEYILFEADTTPDTQKNNAPTTFDDKTQSKENTDPNNKEVNNNRKAIVKAVTTYMSATTKLLSAKMSILNKQKREAFLILNHFYASKKVNATAVAAKDKANQIRTDVVQQVDTRLDKK